MAPWWECTLSSSHLSLSVGIGGKEQNQRALQALSFVHN